MSADRETGCRPGKLWSLLDVLELKAAVFMHLMQVMSNSQALVEGTSGNLPTEIVQTCGSWADSINALCEEIGLVVTQRSTEYIRQAKTSEDLDYAFRHVKSTIHDELKGQSFYAPHANAQAYFRKDKLFGDAVWTAFPSANDDIYEAGMCLALDRYTACVMHLMRASEVGLKALGQAVGVGEQTDWGAYIREVIKGLDTKAGEAGKRAPDAQFYSEIAVSFDRVRRAWRNPSMHVERSYTLEQAEEIFQSTRSFMQHVAERFAERPAL